MGVFVFILSHILFCLIAIASFSGTIVVLTLTLQFKRLDAYFWNCAITIDQTGNVFAEYPLNFFLIQRKSKDRFGNPDETISSVLGKNKQTNNFKLFGYCLDRILHKIDNNHSIKSIEEDE